MSIAYSEGAVKPVDQLTENSSITADHANKQKLYPKPLCKKESVSERLTPVLLATLSGCNATIEGISLVIPASCTLDEKKKIGKRLACVTSSGTLFFKFLLGDWYNCLSDTYGDRKPLCEELLGEGRSHQARDAGFIARGWDRREDRDETLPWEFYKITASLNIPRHVKLRYQSEWLAKKWTVDTLRKEIKEKYPSALQERRDNNKEESLVTTLPATAKPKDDRDVTIIREGNLAPRPLFPRYDPEAEVLIGCVKTLYGVSPFRLSKKELIDLGVPIASDEVSSPPVLTLPSVPDGFAVALDTEEIETLLAEGTDTFRFPTDALREKLSKTLNARTHAMKERTGIRL